MAFLANYALPFLMCVLVVGAVAWRIRSLGGPASLFFCFAGILFLPSLVYAAIYDESDGLLLGLSLAAACLVTALLAFLDRKKASGA